MRPADWLNRVVDRVAIPRRLHALGIGWRQRPSSGGSATPGMHTGEFGETMLGGAMARVPFASLGGLFGEGGQAQIGELVRQCSDGWPFAADMLGPQDIAAALPEVYLLGLAPALLAAVQAYLEEPCLYLGAMMKVERVAPGKGTRLWHFDIEDQRMIRVLVYLNEVTPADGPLEVLPADLSREARDALQYRTGLVSDEQMAAIVPECRWVPCPAAAGDALLFDGTQLFHRARPPAANERYSITYSYATRKPLQIYRGARLLERTQKELMAMLSPEQRTCFPRPRLF